jgi:HlyD family secretion protein
MAKPRKRGKPIGCLATIVILIAAAIAGRQGLLKKAGWSPNGPEGPKGPSREVRTGKAEIGDIRVVVREIGTIQPAEKAEVKAPVSGRIIALMVEEGDAVHRGDPLAEIEPDISQSLRFSQVKSALDQARLRLQDAERKYRDAQQLYKEGFYSLDNLEAARLNYDTARQTYENALLDFENYKRQGFTKPGQRSSILYSQWDGVVIARNVELGEMVLDGTSSFNTGTVIFEIADLSEMLIEAAINEVDIGKVREGMPVEIRVDAFPKARYTGRVTHISPAARTIKPGEIKVFDIKVSIDQKNTQLRSGMTANIDIQGDKRENVLTVPVEAVFHREEGDVVYVKRPSPPETDSATAAAAEQTPPEATPLPEKERWKLQFEERQVEIGLVDETRAEILSGLEEGEIVALEDPSRPPEEERSFF